VTDKTNILYLSYDGITDPLGQSQILPYLKGLCKKGYAFHLVGFEKPHAYKNQKKIIEQEVAATDIHWVPMRYHKSPQVLSTLYDIWQMRGVAKKLVKKNDIKIVHCRSYIPMLIGLYLKRKYDIKLIFDMRGFWADERVDGKIWDLKNPIFRIIYNYFKKKEIEFSLKSDHIVSLTHAGKEEMVSGRLFKRKSIKITEDQISVIPCAVDMNLFDSDKISKSIVKGQKSKLGLNADDKILIYLGSLGTWYLVKEMLKFYKLWLEQHPQYKFLWVTKDNTDPIKNYCHELDIDLSNIFFASADRSQVPAYLKMADLGIFFIKPAYSKKASSAVKMGEMMAMGLPIVTNSEVGDTTKLLGQQDCAALIDIESDLDTIDKFQIIHSTTSTELIELAHDYFDLSRGIESYFEAYKKSIN